MPESSVFHGPGLAKLFQLFAKRSAATRPHWVWVPGRPRLALSSEPIVDVHGNILFFRTVVSKTHVVETEVTLILPSAIPATAIYPGILSAIKRGEKAVYAIQRMPAVSTTTANSTAAPNPATLSLVALVTGQETLPQGLIDYSMSGKFELLKIASGFLTGGPDVLYLGQRSSSGTSVQVLTFDGAVFKPSGSPVPLS
jgi:hypothetical protein